MPEICRFLGIVITMYFNDHNPPHFHVRYEDFRAIVGIDRSSCARDDCRRVCSA
jgi:hypothetical protein